MREEIKDKWVAALESGDYKQTRGVLRRGDSYCCLGVLCDLYYNENPESQWNPVTPTTREFAKYEFIVPDESYHNTGVPPNPVYQWAGMLDENGDVPAGTENYLTNMNDDGIPFPKIAEWIKENL